MHSYELDILLKRTVITTIKEREILRRLPPVFKTPSKKETPLRAPFVICPNKHQSRRQAFLLQRYPTQMLSCAYNMWTFYNKVNQQKLET
jgi:hypothetical protein